MTEAEVKQAIDGLEMLEKSLKPDDVRLEDITVAKSVLQNAFDELTCLTTEVTSGLGLIDDVADRIGCKAGNCGTERCPQTWRCQAGRLRGLAASVRRCLGIAETRHG